jgi:hypothetical protein
MCRPAGEVYSDHRIASEHRKDHLGKVDFEGGNTFPIVQEIKPSASSIQAGVSP